MEMAAYAEAGHFKAGSMGPKVDAAIRFARAGGTAIIAELLDALPALKGEAGTWITPTQRRGRRGERAAGR